MNRNKLGSSAKKQDSISTGFNYNGSSPRGSLGQKAFIFNNFKKPHSTMDDDNDDFQPAPPKKQRSMEKPDKQPTSATYQQTKIFPIALPIAEDEDSPFQTIYKPKKRSSVSVEMDRVSSYYSTDQPSPSNQLSKSSTSYQRSPSLATGQSARRSMSEFSPASKRNALNQRQGQTNKVEVMNGNNGSANPYSLNQQTLLTMNSSASATTRPNSKQWPGSPTSRHLKVDPQLHQQLHHQHGDNDGLYALLGDDSHQSSRLSTSRRLKMDQQNYQQSDNQQMDDDVDDLYKITNTPIEPSPRRPKLQSQSSILSKPKSFKRLYQKPPAKVNDIGSKSPTKLASIFTPTLSVTPSELIKPELNHTKRSPTLHPQHSAPSNIKLYVPKKQHLSCPDDIDNSKSATGTSGLVSNKASQQIVRNRANSNEKSTDNGGPRKHCTNRMAAGEKQTLSIKKNKLLLPEKQKMKKMGLLTSLPSQATSDRPSSPKAANEDLAVCPYCLAVLDLNLSNVVALAYDEIKHKEKEYQDIQQPTADDVFDSLELQNGLTRDDSPSINYRKRRFRRSVSNRERFEFCQLHNIELVIKPKGDKHNWPSIILFEKLLDRILGFKHELDMVIAKKLESSYRTLALEAYKDLGMHKARSTMGMMTRFETVLPGYYGTKGAAIIQEHLAALYLHQGKLGRDVVAPQTAMEYLQQVLIPEVGFRLIREDLVDGDSDKQHDPDIDNQAKRIMAESAAYGSSLHPVDWNDALSADEDNHDNEGNDDDSVALLDGDFDGGCCGNNDLDCGDQGYGVSVDQDRKDEIDVATQYILDDTTEDEDDQLVSQSRIPTKKPKFYDLIND